MVIVVEGMNGSGKTKVIEKFTEKHPNFKKIRMYDRTCEEGLHSIKDRISCMGDKTNDYLEDLHILEFVRQSGINVVLDRSIISATIHRMLRKERPVSQAIMTWWFKTLVKLDPVYVWFKVSYDNVNLRSDKIMVHQEYGYLHQAFKYWYKLITLRGDIGAFHIDTNQYSIGGTVKQFEDCIESFCGHEI